MNTSGFLVLKNKLRTAQWWLRWREGGGSMHWAARPLRDLRNDEDLMRYRMIELKRRHTPYGRLVVNINAWKRIRQKQYRRMVAV